MKRVHVFIDRQSHGGATGRRYFRSNNWIAANRMVVDVIAEVTG
jgi:hypothetical protein